MHRRVVWLVFAFVALAGCSSGVPDDGSAVTSSSSSSSSSTSSTTTSGTTTGTSTQTGAAGPTDTPPSATLEAAPVGGNAPLLVAFRFNGTDPDGDALSWRFDADGDGTADAEGGALPATYEHTYAEGTFLANLTVTAGNASAYATAIINVTAASGEPEPEQPQSQSVDASYVVAAEGCTAPAAEAAGSDVLAPAGDETDDVIRVQFSVEPGTIGKAWTAAFTFDQGYLYVAVDFFNAEDDLVHSTNTGQVPNFGNLNLSGTVPAGAAKAVLFACAGPTEASVHYQAG